MLIARQTCLSKILPKLL